MQSHHSIFWKKSPFVRIIIALITGILSGYYLKISPNILLPVIGITIISLFSFSFIPIFNRYKFAFVNGLLVFICFSALGAVLVWKEDIRNNQHWFGNYITGQYAVVATLSEPVSEKPKTFKAIANVSYMVSDKLIIPCKGKIIIYLKKNKMALPEYGSSIFIYKPPEEIQNFTAGFNYKRYCLFRGITHQVFLKPEEYKTLPGKGNAFRSFIFKSRKKIVDLIRKNIPGKKEAGLAEALLIGYKDDLDKTLVKSYTNTGVVHIIAISGLHLGLIYLFLSAITRPLVKYRIRWLRPIFIISCLWLFSLLAGAQASILRSAFMFTCIVLGEMLRRQSSIYNSMALSAFIIICLNPFALWDIGFQLSYAAVLSIVLFMRPVYNVFYIKNKLVDYTWKLNAITLSAQVLTLPLCIYHFQQFPNFFMITNFIAVPLSSIILFGEIFLCLIFFIQPVAAFIGQGCSALIRFMNNYIERIESIPWSVSYGLKVNFVQMLSVYLFIIATAYWLLEKKSSAMKFGLLALLCFILFR